MSTFPKLLICDDDRLLHTALKIGLKSKYDVVSAYHGDEALVYLKKQSFQAIILDIRIRTQDEGLRYITQFKAIDADMAIIIVSGVQEFSIVKEALRLGADDYIIKDSEVDTWTIALDRAIEKKLLSRAHEIRDHECVRAEQKNVLIGKSPQIEVLRRQIHRARDSSASILIQGETGTGKEVVARMLRQSEKNGVFKPFIAVDSATIQNSMAESLLFGYEKGAFTGAEKATRGLFEEADGGSIYFDEMANMPISIQNKLLRVIQEKEVMRLGSSRAISLNFRVISATNRDLFQMVRESQFKEDLFHRINVIPISVPALRERKEDIPLLINTFLKLQNSSRNMSFSEGALYCLMQYSWPGNVRELYNLISFLVSMSEFDEVQESDLPAKFRDFSVGGEKVAQVGDFYQQVRIFEKNLLNEAYLKFKGNVSQMAISLGMDRSHLYHKLKEYGIHQVRSK